MVTIDYEPYRARTNESHGVITRAGHRLKVYSIRYSDEPFEMTAYREGLERALDQLPEASPEEGRPGLGFVIVHRGRGSDYVVLGWWDRENELPIRVMVRDDGPWRPARGGESVCVWDLDVICRERDAYVETVLAPGAGEDAAEAYLERRVVG